MYRSLSDEIRKRIEEDRTRGIAPFRTSDSAAHRRDAAHDRQNETLRPAFARDAEKILHSATYNRYADKTQVFSFYKNDDLTRRGLHVQLVSRAARTLGAVLGLNLDLIEAIALGHDIGHTPFGHAGEHYLSEITEETLGEKFEHNVHSVRVLDRIYHHNLTLETLSGILSHNGEVAASSYRPQPCDDFSVFDRQFLDCYTVDGASAKLIPSTLEGCLVRICDMVAYLGKDRQDAERIGLLRGVAPFTDCGIGTFNAEMMNNLQVDLIENSYGKPEISMSPECFHALEQAKKENYEKIYLSPAVREVTDNVVRPMMRELFSALLDDYARRGTDSLVYRHHVEKIEADFTNRRVTTLYREEKPERIVADYIASMTDDYFFDLYKTVFPKKTPKIEYHGYFETR